MKTIILARVSTEDQDSNSAQVTRLKDFATSKGFADKPKIYEIEESSSKANREKLQEVIEYIKKSKEKVSLFVDTIDRLQRSFRESVVFDDLRKAGKVEIFFFRENLHLHQKSNSADLIRWDMGVMFARSYVLQLSDNVKRRFEQMRREGHYFGPLPLGYLGVAEDEKKRLRGEILFDPIRGHLIQKMFELYATGNYSITTLRNEMIKLGLRTHKDKLPVRSIIDGTLKNTLYFGLAQSEQYGPYEVENVPRLISKDLFDRCMEIRLKRKKTPSKANLKKEYILGDGLLKCKKCGCSISFETKTKPSGKVYIIGACTNAKGMCKKEYVNENDFLKPIYKVLDKFETITEDVQNDLLAEIRKHSDSEIEFHQIQINRIRKQYQDIKDKDDRLLDAFLDQSITKDIYDKKHQEYADKLQLLNIELEEHTDANSEYQTTLVTVLSVAKRARSIFDGCSEPMQKRAFLKFILQNPVVNGKKLEFSMVSPYNLVLELADSPDLLPRQGSNLRQIDYIDPKIT